jgi:hypothetical protein
MSPGDTFGKLCEKMAKHPRLVSEFQDFKGLKAYAFWFWCRGINDVILDRLQLKKYAFLSE